MGNKSNKHKKIPKFISPPHLDELPVEIIYKILDQLDLSIIIESFYHVSKHFDEILSTYNEYHLNLNKISFKNLKIICSRIRPEQIVELILSDDENTSGLLEYFLSKYSIPTFERLRSLTLTKINNEEFMNQILIPIGDRRSLSNVSSIRIINTEEAYGELFLDVIMSILNKSSLRQVYFDLSYSRTTSNPLPWIEESPIKQLTFVGSCSVSFIRNTFMCVPQLEIFKVDDLDFDDEVDLNPIPPHHAINDESTDSNEDQEFGIEEELNINENRLPREEQYATINSPIQLKSLMINGSTISMSKLEWFLKEIPTLKSLRLLTVTMFDDEAILDGQRWENLLDNFEKFEFVFTVNLSIDSKWDIDKCIEKYRTLFWIEEKKWFVSLEKYDQEIIFYTFQYRNIFYVMKNGSAEFEYRSTVDAYSNLQIQAMNYVEDLYIDASTMKRSHFENIISPRFSHIKNLYLYGQWPKLNTFFSDIKTIVNLDNIEELIRDECIPTADFRELLESMPNLRSVKTSTNLLDALNAARFSYKKCLHSITIDTNTYSEQRPVNVEPFCDMFPRVEYVNIPVDTVHHCQYFLEHKSEDLISVTFRIPSNDSLYSDDESPSEDTFSEWVKDLPKQYQYFKKQQQLIHIWLK